ncbi:MAG: hypothetical protein K8R74_09435 [Bacteroidales bacterium]|nr:hypothetical protein [Bacteroidales bacterium]
MKSYKNIAKSIRSGLADIKAEVLIGDLIDKGIDVEKMLVKSEGLFGRNYSKDVSDVFVDMVRKIIVFHIARDGLYDVLPEGLFHPVSRYSNLDAEERKKEFKIQKQEEANARKFFMPFDNELFFQRVKLEIELLRLIRDPLTIFKRLYFIDATIPDEFYRRFIAFLPFTNEVKGDIELTAFCLSEILGEEVTHKSFYLNTKNNISDLINYSSEENNLLGENFICGNNFQESILTWEFSIILENESRLIYYANLEKGFANKLIEKYYNFFVPVEIEVKTKYICKAGRPLILGDLKEDDAEHKKPELYLGYNTTI